MGAINDVIPIQIHLFQLKDLFGRHFKTEYRHMFAQCVGLYNLTESNHCEDLGKRQLMMNHNVLPSIGRRLNRLFIIKM